MTLTRRRYRDTDGIVAEMIVDVVNGIDYPVHKLSFAEENEGGLLVSEDNPLPTISFVHKEIHNSSSFFVMYSVASLDAMAAPDDMITLTWNTPNTTKWGHFQFGAKGSADWRIRLIEAPTGGAINPTGALPIRNKNRNSAVRSTFTDGAVVNQVGYDATLATGGNTLWDEYLEGAGGPKAAGASGGGDRDEIILRQNTQYQLSLFGANADPATLLMSWYEHTGT